MNLYSKAQNGGLNAQEVFWLESQLAVYPSFAMAYIILARHHFRNQSTVKNKVLLKAAAYASNRTLLRQYLEDTLAVPKPRPIPVSEIGPSLEKKDAASQQAPPIALAKQEDPPLVVEEATPPPVAGTDVVEHTEMSASVVEQVEAAPLSGLESSAQLSQEHVLSVSLPEVNWFLNMRIKLRADKYKSLSARLRESIAQHATDLKQPSTAVELPPVEHTPTPPATEEKPAHLGAVDASIPPPVDAPTMLATGDAPSIPAMEDALSMQEQEQQPSVMDTETELPALDTPMTAIEERKATTLGVEAPRAQVTAIPAEKEYEIGAFSSFTFLSEEDADEAEEVIDTELTMLEAVEVQAHDLDDGYGEIIFEENDRIIEVTVSPEALSKYFKGRLPADHAVSFGEFKIELDEREYHAPEEAPSHEEEKGRGQALMPKEPSAEKMGRDKVDALIDKFIENEPAISRGKPAIHSSGDLARDSGQVNEEWVTETLARIYEKQGNKAKAIKIYEQLRLRFPEKNDYFAHLIENLKQ